MLLYGVCVCLPLLLSTATSMMAVLDHTQMNQLAYKNYLEEVVEVLMTDKKFADKVHDAWDDLSNKVVSLPAVFIQHMIDT